MQRRVSFVRRLSPAWRLSLVASVAVLLTGAAIYSGRANSPIVVSISSYSMQPDDLAALARSSDLVVEGVVKEIKSAVWTTPDGQPPSDPAAMLTNPLEVQLRTPILLSVAHSRKGRVTGDLLFTIPGGTSKTYRVMEEDPRTLKAGDQIVVFLSSAPPGAGAWAKISPYFPQYFFLVNDGRLIGTQKSIQRADFDRQMAAFPENK